MSRPGLRRTALRALIAALAIAAAQPAAAAAVLLIDFLTLAAIAIDFVAEYAVYIAFTTSVYGGMDARRRARAAAARARGDYNNSLADRNITALSVDPPLRAVYGRCITGGDVVAILTSDKQGVRDNGSSYTKPDGYKHLVIIVAARQVQAINEVLIDGVPVGPIDANGWATTGAMVRQMRAYRELTLASGASFTGPSALQLANAWDAAGQLVTSTDWNGNTSTTFNGRTVSYTISGAGLTVTNTSSFVAIFSLSYLENRAPVRISKLLGSPTQAADPWLLANVPALWTTNDRLCGLAGVVVTLDLEESNFQGGPPAIKVDVSGHLLYDPRTGLTAWSANPALVARDYLCSSIGMGCAAGDIDDAYVITAANACDALVSMDAAWVPTYTCNGAISSDDGREAVLDDLAESMAGQIVCTARWLVLAGAWAPSALDLGDADLHGQIEVVQAGSGLDDVFNGVRARFIPAGSSVEDEPTPYQNAAFVAADGVALWTDVQLPFTDSRQRSRNIARVLTERNRAGQVLRVPCQLRAWALQIGDRVRLSSTEYGITLGYYRITDWQFGLKSAVLLTLQGDAASIYDQADADTPAVLPASTLPLPWVVSPINGLSASSGTAELQRMADGTISARVRLSWTPISDSYIASVGSQIIVRWRRPLTDAPLAWQQQSLPGTDVGTWLTDVVDGDLVVVVVYALNRFGSAGAWSVFWHTVVGKTQPPADVASLAWQAEEFGVRLSWPRVSDIDIQGYELRVDGSSWATATVLDRDAAPGWLWRVQATGARTVRVKARDTTGHYSANAASTVINVPAPAAPALSFALDGQFEVLSWSTPASAFAIDHYELRYGAAGVAWASASYLDTVKGNSLRRRASFAGARGYLCAAVDAASNVGASGGVDVFVASPGAPTAGRSEVVDNNALLYWAAPASGSLPVERYEVRRGATWAGGTLVGSNGNSTFTTVFEQSAGVYAYQIGAWDSAGNLGPPLAITANINQPPDYVLRQNIDSTLALGTRTNLVLDGGALLGPVDTSQSWSTHFSSQGWASPADQVAAGYPLYLSPSLANGSYDETFDYGATLPSTTITATLASSLVTGAVAVACQIYTKLNIGDAWTAALAGATSVLASNFRYVRVVWTLSCTAGANLIKISGFNLKLAVKMRRDGGSAVAAVGGTVVNFNVAFIDANTPLVQPSGATPLTPVVIFAGGANPTSFTVKLYNASGTDVGGAFGWGTDGH